MKEAEYAPRANKFQVPLVTMEGDPERRMALVSGDRVRGPSLPPMRSCGNRPAPHQSVRRQQEQPIHPNLDTKPQWNTTTQFSADEWRGQVRHPRCPPSSVVPHPTRWWPRPEPVRVRGEAADHELNDQVTELEDIQGAARALRGDPAAAAARHPHAARREGRGEAQPAQRPVAGRAARLQHHPTRASPQRERAGIGMG